ncbi:hypothetical protein C1646_753453 [Rhizophagus diaphanus]|nr:hypothetical protein C1646_753453 [Rhizophagus diaphanus] [Rhizophagus sp. MUCL 43196]
MSSIFLAELSSDYEKLFETELGYDVIIYAGEESNVRINIEDATHLRIHHVPLDPMWN